MYTPVKERENKSFGYTPVAQRSGFTETPISSGIYFDTKTSTPQTIEQGSISKFTSGVGSFLKQAPLGRVITAIKENKSITEVAKAILPTEREGVSLDDPEKIVELAFNFLPVGMVNRAKKASQIAKEAYEAQQLLKKTGQGIDSLPKQLSNEARDIVVKSFEKPKVDVTDFKPTLQQEAKKFKSADEFIEANIDSYTKTTKEYKDWAKGNKNIIEAYHGTPYSFDKFEIGKKQSGVYELDGISFASEKNLAEPFSRQFPDSYYDKKSMLDKKFPKVSETKSNLDKIEAQSKKRGTDSIKKEGKEVSDALKERLQKKKDMIKDFSDRSLNQDDLAKFKEENSYSYGRLRELENELKVSKNKKDIDVSLSDKKDLKIYNEELKKLENEVQGNIYKVYIKGKNIIDEVGEEIGFSGSRNDIVAQLDGDILRIKDADTGQYIGEEIIINDPKQVFIVNSPKTKSQLKDIYNKANKPLGDLTK